MLNIDITEAVKGCPHKSCDFRYDCQSCWEQALLNHDKQIREAAIDELKNKLYERTRDKGIYASEYIAFIDFTFEQLKEQK